MALANFLRRFAVVFPRRQTVLASVPIVHNSCSHYEVQSLGLSPPSQAQTPSAKAGLIVQLPSGGRYARNRRRRIRALGVYWQN